MKDFIKLLCLIPLLGFIPLSFLPEKDQFKDEMVFAFWMHCTIMGLILGTIIVSGMMFGLEILKDYLNEAH